MASQVDIVTPERMLISDEVDMVTLPGMSGQMGILRGHAPLLSTLDIGEIVLHRGNESEYIAVGGGVAEVRPDKVTILADSAEHEAEIDLERAQAAMERAQKFLAEGGPPERRPIMARALRRSHMRIRVARRRPVRHRDAPSFQGDSGS